MIIKSHTPEGDSVWLVDENNVKIDRVTQWDTERKVATIHLANNRGQPITDNNIIVDIEVYLPNAELVLAPDVSWDTVKELGISEYIVG